MTDNMTEALREYLQLRQRLTELDARESECTCDSSEFHRCDLCQECADTALRVRAIMSLWAEEFAVALAIKEGVMLEVFAQ